jgi:hypothetical protein
MFSLKRSVVVRRLLDLPIRRKLYWIVGVLAADLALVIGIGVFGMWALSSLRAYVGGEGLWAEAGIERGAAFYFTLEVGRPVQTTS